MDWLAAELADTLDEDYELEISEPALSLEIRRIYRQAHPPSLERKDYFLKLLHLPWVGARVTNSWCGRRRRLIGRACHRQAGASGRSTAG